MSGRRRVFLKAMGALACGALPRRAFPDPGAAPAGGTGGADFCAANEASPPLFVPGRQRLFGRLAPAGARLAMRAAPTEGNGPWTQGFHVEYRGARYVNPTLLLQRGERVNIAFANALRQPTSVHWHGLAVATRNDGAVTPPVDPDQRYDYVFDVRDRSCAEGPMSFVDDLDDPLHRQMYGYWQQKRGSRRMPSRADLDPRKYRGSCPTC